MSIRELGPAAVVALICALITALLIAFGSKAFLFLLMSWPVQIVGMLALALALWRTRRWWLLVCLPFLAFPLGMWAMLFYQCSQGNCL